jgi:hypothetical protein
LEYCRIEDKGKVMRLLRGPRREETGCGCGGIELDCVFGEGKEQWG